MIKTAIILMMTIMMVIISTTISLQTHEVYAEDKAKKLCSEYDGEWDNGKCKIKDDEDKADSDD